MTVYKSVDLHLAFCRDENGGGSLICQEIVVLVCSLLSLGLVDKCTLHRLASPQLRMTGYNKLTWFSYILQEPLLLVFATQCRGTFNEDNV